MSTRGDYFDQWSHHEWEHLVAAKQDFVVHVDKQLDIDWETSVNYDQIEKANSAFNSSAKHEILTRGAILEATPCSELPRAIQIQFKRLVGEAYCCCFEFDYDRARKVLKAAEQFIQARSEERARSWYLTASGCSAGILAIVLCIAWAARSFLTELIGLTAFWVGVSVLTGGIGALLSVITRAGRLQIDCSAGRALHNLEGSSRIVAGAISGGLAGLAVLSGILFQSISESHLMAVVILVATSAGYTERMAPSIISSCDLSGKESRTEQKANKDESRSK